MREGDRVKLNYKRTILVGFAFFLICTFWQAYDTIIPKILTDRFGLPQAWSGIVMALDNILALFLLPLFGSLSDRCHTRMGKRKPFVLVGTVVAVAAFMLLTAADSAQLTLIREVTEVDASKPAYSQALSTVYTQVGERELSTPDGKRFRLAERYTAEEFAAIRPTVTEGRIAANRTIRVTNRETGEGLTIQSPYKTHIVTYDGVQFFLRDRETELDTPIDDTLTVDGYSLSLSALCAAGAAEDAHGVSAFASATNAVYTNYVVPARQAYIHTLTVQNPTHLIRFMLILVVVLAAMSVFRSPAVALMPDVTVKPLRSKANAIINLMGTLGGICVLVLGMGFAFNNSAVANTFRPSYGFFGVVSGIMLAALVVFMLTVRERKWAAEMEAETARLEAAGEAPVEEDRSGDRKLSRGEQASLLLILASVALWYFGYNAVTSKYSVYATNVLDLDYSATLLIANAAAVLSYIPVGFISSRIGRKKSILAGVAMLAVAFGAACFVRVGSSPLIMNATFALAGIGWASINVNSFPMVVELSTGGNIGRYTGYYYAASMAAQALTPFLSGLFMDHLGMTALFPYATVFVSLSFLTMLCVRHGDSKPVPKGSVLEQLDVGDD